MFWILKPIMAVIHVYALRICIIGTWLRINHEVNVFCDICQCVAVSYSWKLIIRNLNDLCVHIYVLCLFSKKWNGNHLCDVTAVMLLNGKLNVRSYSWIMWLFDGRIVRKKAKLVLWLAATFALQPAAYKCTSGLNGPFLMVVIWLVKAQKAQVWLITLKD